MRSVNNLLSILRKIGLICLLCGVFVGTAYVIAAEASTTPPVSLSMTLTPPLYQISLAPGATWASNLQFVNGNSYPLTVYMSVQNFRATKESGIELFPRSDFFTESPYELALWITHPLHALEVEAGKVINIPFTIKVPLDAEPGGHYAAMMVGTDPVAKKGVQEMSVSSAITSLLLVRVGGDVREAGNIHDFFSESWITQTQEAIFHLKFANTGNVHIEPEGDIVITNMFGKSRGSIVMGESNEFGNILPNSIKEFSFAWEGEKTFFDIGLYRARASLEYGENNDKAAYHSTYFLVFPYVPTLTIISFLTVFIWFIRRGVTYYVANAVRIEQHRDNPHHINGRKNLHNVSEVTFAVLSQPIINGVLDLSPKNALPSWSHGTIKEQRGLGSILKKLIIFYRGRFKKYYSFFVFFLLFFIGLGVIGSYFYQVFKEERQFHVTTQNDATKGKPSLLRS